MLRRSMVVLMLAACAAWTGCSRPQPLGSIPLDQARVQARDLPDEQLLQRTRDYNVLIRQKRVELARLNSELSDLEARTDAPAESLEKTRHDRDVVAQTLPPLVERYKICFDQVLQRRLPATGLELD